MTRSRTDETTQTEPGFPCDWFVEKVRSLAGQRLEKVNSGVGLTAQLPQLLSGKMLRTRLAGRLASGLCADGDVESLVPLCAAIEIVHTASLCHDDVIDNALIRRAQPTLWRSTCTSGAILIGDLFLCEGLDLVIQVGNARHLSSFVKKVRQVIEAEAKQELIYRGQPLDREACLWLARYKTGPLFAFAASVCAGDDEALSKSLAEAGYHIGTAYQLADDLLDLVGAEDVAGKTLGTDRQRHLITLARTGEPGERLTQETVQRLCGSAVAELAGHPQAQNALREFLACDLQPVLQDHLTIPMESAV